MPNHDSIDRNKPSTPEPDRAKREQHDEAPRKRAGETAREQQPDNPLSRLKFGNAGSGGAELEPGPEKP